MFNISLGKFGDVNYRPVANNFVKYFKTDGFRSDGKVNGLLWAEVASRGIHSMMQKEGSTEGFGKLAVWFQGLQAVKGIFSFAAAKDSITNGRYVHAGYEVFFWGGDAVKKAIEAGAFSVSDSTKTGISTVRNLGALCGVISSYKEVEEALDAFQNGRLAEDGITRLNAKDAGFGEEVHQKAADFVKLAGAVLLLGWTALQLVGKEFKKMEGILTTLRVTYSIADMMYYVTAKTLEDDARDKGKLV